MKTYAFALGLLLTTTIACDAKEECIADCGDSSSTGSPSQTETTAGDDSSSGGPTAACEEPAAAADAFVEANRSCETVLDCVLVDGICYPNSGPCGTVALSADADTSTWDALSNDLAEACECGANPCGSAAMCTDEGQCEAVFFSDAYCPSIERDVQTFLAANRVCETDDDCVAVESTCHVDECSVVALNVDANTDDWRTLDETLWSCDTEEDEQWCNFVGDCGADIRCGDDGLCTAVF